VIYLIPYNQNATYHAYLRYNVEAGQWTKWERNRPVWVIGVNGFAVQAFHSVVKPLQRLNIRDMAKAALEADAATKTFDDKDVQWVLDGYDVCNDMQKVPTLSKPYTDQIKLLRSDGSVLRLVKRTPTVTTSNREETMTGHYVELSSSPNGYAFVEFIPNSEYSHTYRLAIKEAFDLDDPENLPIEYRPRRLWYFDGTGAAYMFEEWKTPFGLDYLTGQARPTNILFADDLATGYGQAFPNTWYLRAIQHQAVNVVNIQRSKHSYSSGLGSGYDATAGKAVLKSIDQDVLIDYDLVRVIVKAGGKTTELELFDELIGGKAPYTPANMSLMLSNASSDAPLVSYEIANDDNDYSVTNLVTSIVDGVGRRTSFRYGAVDKTILGTEFPLMRPQGATTLDYNLTWKERRLKYVLEPSRDIALTYYSFDTLRGSLSTSEAPVSITRANLEAIKSHGEHGNNSFFSTMVAKVSYHEKGNINQPALVLPDPYKWDTYSRSAAIPPHTSDVAMYDVTSSQFQENGTPEGIEAIQQTWRHRTVRINLVPVGQDDKVDVTHTDIAQHIYWDKLATSVTNQLGGPTTVGLKTIKEIVSADVTTLGPTAVVGQAVGRLPVATTTYRTVGDSNDRVILTREQYAYTFSNALVPSGLPAGNLFTRLGWRIDSMLTTVGKAYTPTGSTTPVIEPQSLTTRKHLILATTTAQVTLTETRLLDKLASGREFTKQVNEAGSVGDSAKIDVLEAAWKEVHTNGLGSIDITVFPYTWVRCTKPQTYTHVMPAVWTPVMREFLLHPTTNTILSGTETVYHVTPGQCFDTTTGAPLMTYARPMEQYRIGRGGGATRYRTASFTYGGTLSWARRIVSTTGPYNEVLEQDYGRVNSAFLSNLTGTIRTNYNNVPQSVVVPTSNVASNHYGVPMRTSRILRKAAGLYGVSSMTLSTFTNYDDRGQPIASIDENGIASLCDYDAIGRLRYGIMSGDLMSEHPSITDALNYGTTVPELRVRGEHFTSGTNVLIEYDCPCDAGQVNPSVHREYTSSGSGDVPYTGLLHIGRSYNPLRPPCSACESVRTDIPQGAPSMMYLPAPDSGGGGGGAAYGRLLDIKESISGGRSVFSVPTRGNDNVTAARLSMRVNNVVGASIRAQFTITIAKGPRNGIATNVATVTETLDFTGAPDGTTHTEFGGLVGTDLRREITIDLNAYASEFQRAGASSDDVVTVDVKGEYVEQVGDGGTIHVSLSQPELVLVGALRDPASIQRNDFTVAFAYDDTRRMVSRFVKIDDRTTTQTNTSELPTVHARHTSSLVEFDAEYRDRITYTGFSWQQGNPAHLASQSVRKSLSASWSSKTYTGLGVMRSATDALGHTTQFHSDASGRIEATVHPATTTWVANPPTPLPLVPKAFTYAAQGMGQQPSGRADDRVERMYMTFADFLRLNTANAWMTEQDYQKRFPNVHPREQVEIEQTVKVSDGNQPSLQDLRSWTVKDVFGRVILTAQGAIGPQAEAVEGNLSITSTTYDRYGRVVQVINPDGVISSYIYDTYGRIRYKFNESTGAVSYSYDRNDRLRFTQTQQQNNTNKVSFYQYDDLGRLTASGEAVLPVLASLDSALKPAAMACPLESTLNVNRYTDILDPSALYITSSSVTHPNVNPSLGTSSVLPIQTFTAGAAPLLRVPCPQERWSGLDSRLNPTLPIMTNVLVRPSFLWNRTEVPSTLAAFEDAVTHHRNYQTIVSYDGLPTTRNGVWRHLPSASVINAISGNGQPLAHQQGRVSAVAYRSHGNEPFHYILRNYDDRGRLTALIRQTENLGFDAVYYTYNSMNLVTSMRIIDPISQVATFYIYDDAGRLSATKTLSNTNGFGAGNPVMPTLIANNRTSTYDQTMSYSKRNELVGATHRAGDQAPVAALNVYNERGWLVEKQATAGPGRTYRQLLTYDKQGRIIESHTVMPGQAQPIKQAYTYSPGQSFLANEIVRINGVAVTNWGLTYTPGGNRTGVAGHRLQEWGNNPAGAVTSTLTYGGTDGVTSKDQLLQYGIVVRNPATTAIMEQRIETLSYDANGSMTQRTFQGINPANVYRKERYDYNSTGLVERFRVQDVGVSGGNPALCTTNVDNVPMVEWRYRYNTALEREQKRMVNSGQGTAHLPWTYYLLGPNNEQLAVWNGFAGTACGSTANTVRLWPVEYNVYSGGERTIIRPNGNRELVMSNHLGSTACIFPLTGVNRTPIAQQITDAYGIPLTLQGAADPQRSRTSFIGRDVDRESILGAFGARLYSSEYGRFVAVDKLWEEYDSFTTYHYAFLEPLTYEDQSGLGPKKRVNVAKSFEGKPYLQETGQLLRTSKTDVGLQYLDCSELVCRVLEADGLTRGVKSMNTGILQKYFLGDEWIIDDTPQAGDIFLHRFAGAGHTGLVTNVVSDNVIEITHARGRKYGTRTEMRKIDKLKSRQGWVGFIRPKRESPDGPITNCGVGTWGDGRINPQLLPPGIL
jgi:RHS repeat-associated protein